MAYIISDVSRNHPELVGKFDHKSNAIRYKLLAPLFENLYENKALYQERFTSLIFLENMVITPEGFKAKAKRHLVVESAGFDVPETWSFSSLWGYMYIHKNSISVPYASWSICLDPGLVQEVEKLLNKCSYGEAWKFFQINCI